MILLSIFELCDFFLYYPQVNAILPLVNSQNKDKYAKTNGKIKTTCEKQRENHKVKKNKGKTTTHFKAEGFMFLSLL